MLPKWVASRTKTSFLITRNSNEKVLNITTLFKLQTTVHHTLHQSSSRSQLRSISISLKTNPTFLLLSLMVNSDVHFFQWKYKFSPFNDIKSPKTSLLNNFLLILKQKMCGAHKITRVFQSSLQITQNFGGYNSK